MGDLPSTAPQLIVEEIRRQVDHQVSAADSLDTRSMAIFAGVAAVAAFIGPRVNVTSTERQLAAAVTLAALVAALICLLFAVRPRVGSFSNGPDVHQLAERIGDPGASLEVELVPAFVQVRDRNETFLASKGDWIIRALRSLIGTVLGIGWMVGVGAIK
jgi:hypothetical protein